MSIAHATPTGESPVDRAFRLLQVVVAAGEPLGIRELARRTGLPRSTVGRLVATLTDLAMVGRTADGAVIAGSALATLQPRTGEAVLGDRLRPLLAELVVRFGENAALSVDDGESLLYVSQVTTEHAVSVPSVSGNRHDFHLVAPGLMTMAWWEPRRVKSAFPSTLRAATATSVTAPSTLKKRLKEIKTQGYCWTDQELDVGVNGVAVPLLRDDVLVATVSLFGPAYRLNPHAQPDLGEELRELVHTRGNALLPTHI